MQRATMEKYKISEQKREKMKDILINYFVNKYHTLYKLQKETLYNEAHSEHLKLCFVLCHRVYRVALFVI